MADWKAAQKLGAYLRHTEGYGILIAPRETGSSVLEPDGHARASRGHLLEVFSDADWSGSQMNRRSMSAAVFYLDGAAVFASCRGQKCVSLSSCESEWYAAVSASCDLLYLKQCLETLLDESPVLKVRLDNSAAKALACREGPSGKTRHVDARLFWVQEKVRTGEINFASVPGLLNPADIATKVLTERRLKALLGAQQVVDVQNSMELVGQSEWHDLLEQQAVTNQIRRITHQVSRRATYSKAFLRVAIISMLMSGAEASLRFADAGSQTEAIHGTWMNVCTIIGVFIALSLEPLRAKLFGHAFDHAAEDSMPNGTDINESDNESVIPRNVSIQDQGVMWVAHDTLVADCTWFILTMLMMLTIFLGCKLNAMRKQIHTLNEHIASLEQSVEALTDDADDGLDEVPAPPQAVPAANPQGVRVLPNPILVTPTGHCYHSPGCHTVGGRTKRLRPCRECLG